MNSMYWMYIFLMIRKETGIWVKSWDNKGNKNIKMYNFSRVWQWKLSFSGRQRIFFYWSRTGLRCLVQRQDLTIGIYERRNLFFFGCRKIMEIQGIMRINSFFLCPGVHTHTKGMIYLFQRRQMAFSLKNGTHTQLHTLLIPILSFFFVKSSTKRHQLIR